MSRASVDAVRVGRARERGSVASRAALVTLVLLAATGVALVFAPASPRGQALLLVHVAIGCAAALPLGVWVARHTALLWSLERGASRTLALLATGLVLVSLASGLGLVALYVGSGFPGAGPRWLHAAAAAGILVLLPVHVVSARRRTGAAERGHPAPVVVALALTALAVWLLGPALDDGGGLRPVPPDHPRTPDGGVFDASFVRTTHEGFVELRRLTGSETCGSCHREIFEEWSASVHRFSGIDNPLVAAATRPAEEKGGLAAARFCAACHEPVALLSGAVTESVFRVPPGHLETGVSCLVCHGIQRVPGTDGNGRMVYAPPDGFAFQNRGSRAADALNRLLVRSFPEAHREAMTPPVIHTSHQCSSCHTVNAHAGLNGFGFVRLHNENDDWSVSAFAHGVGEAGEVVGCQDCHMGRVEGSRDPVARRRGGRHRSHRFLAANTFVARHLGGEEQLRATERFLRGEAVPAEIRHLVPEGPPVSIAIEAPATADAGSELELAVVLTNRGVGHAFPAGPNEVNEAWVELVVRDAAGEVLLARGLLDEDGERDPEAFALVSVPVDAEGNEIFVTGGLAAGFRLRRAILHGAADREHYRVALPPELAGESVEVAARLRYRKSDAAFARRLEGFSIHDVPVTDIAEARRSVRVRGVSSAMVAAEERDPVPETLP